jgi:hypothetical protein
MTIKKTDPFALIEMFLQNIGSHEPTYESVSKAFNLANNSIPYSEEEIVIEAIDSEVNLLKQGMNLNGISCNQSKFA